MEACNAKYYTLDFIPKYRSDYINLRLRWFIDILDLKRSSWPIDCTQLIDKLKVSGPLSFEYGFIELPDKYDAFTEYKGEYDLYLMLINKNKVKYPFEVSSDRRLNFTLAHELGHIALGHLSIPRDLKTEAEKEFEEIEADEFAGRFLMPEKLIVSCNYYSLDSAAAYFKVSKTALWKRLNNIKRLNLLISRKIPACSTCGNTHFSVFAEYCGICGTPLKKNTYGIQRFYYPQEFEMDTYKRVLKCPVCGSPHLYGDKCTKCGTHIFNYCSEYLKGNEDCTYSNPSNSRFCEMCGKPTYYYKRGLLNSWEYEVDNSSII